MCFAFVEARTPWFYINRRVKALCSGSLRLGMHSWAIMGAHTCMLRLHVRFGRVFVAVTAIATCLHRIPFRIAKLSSLCPISTEVGDRSGNPRADSLLHFCTFIFFELAPLWMKMSSCHLPELDQFYWCHYNPFSSYFMPKMAIFDLVINWLID